MNCDKTVIILDKISFFGSCDLAENARRLGYKVFVIVNEGAPLDLKPDADFEIQTISDWRYEALRDLVLGLAEQHNVVGVTSVVGFFTGQGLLAADVSRIAQELGLPYTEQDALMLSNNKFLMRQALQQQSVYTVRHAMAEDLASLEVACEYVGFPLILKPVVGVGSSFISLCRNWQEAKSRFEQYLVNVDDGYYASMFGDHEYTDKLGQYHRFSPQTQMLVEEAIDGIELSVECLCTEDEIHALMIHDKIDVVQSDYCSFENLLITPPIRVDEQQQAELKAYAVDVLRALGLKNCLSHVELRLDSLGRPSIIEANPRVGGMRVKDSLKDVMGINATEIIVKQVVGEPIELPPLKPVDQYYGMCAVYTYTSGTVTGIEGVEQARAIEGMIDLDINTKVGSKIGGDFEETFAVTCWFKGDTPEDIIHIDKQVKQLIRLEVEPHES